MGARGRTLTSAERQSGSCGLVLGRKAGQAIDVYLPDGAVIAVSVDAIRPGQVRLRVLAGRDVRILRRELGPLAATAPAASRQWPLGGDTDSSAATPAAA